MRRADREITAWPELVDVLRRADTIRLGLHDEPYPYVVPLSFGFEDCGGQIALYIHGAKKGLKHTLLARNHHVCVEAGIFHRYAEIPAGGLTTVYESVIGFGTAEIVEGETAMKGLELICSHCGFHGHVIDEAALAHVRVYRITLVSITGKRRKREAME